MADNFNPDEFLASSGAPRFNPDQFLGQPSAAAAPDKYRQAAIEDRNKLIAAGVTPAESYTRRIGQGAGLGWTDELMAGLETPIQMVRRGIGTGDRPANETIGQQIRRNLNDIREGYRYASAGQNLALEKSRENTAGLLGGTAEVAGGLATGAGVLGPATRLASTAGTYGKNILTAGGLGVVGGAGEAPTVTDIPEHAAIGGVLGLGIGTVAPAIPYLARPFTGRMRNPEKMATEFVAEKARMAGQTPEKITQEITDAAAAGQPYTVADVLGKEGQRGLAGMAKVPGEQRNLITEVLINRGENMPYRLQEQIGEGLGVQGTAEAAARSLRRQAQTAAAPIYQQAEKIATYSPRIQEFIDDPISKSALAAGVKQQRIAAVGDNVPFNPTYAALDAEGNIIAVPNVRTLQTLKIGLDKMIEENTDVLGNMNRMGRALVKFKNGLNTEMGNLNPAYAEANRIYAGPMQVRDAIKAGQDMVTRGRYQDTVPAFRSLSPTEQQGVRIGAVDKVLAQAETGRYPSYLKQGNVKGANELGELSLYQGPMQPGMADQLRRRLNREQTMRETEKAALGGSPTAENLADMGAGPGGIPSAMGMVTSAMHGNPIGFVRNAYETAAKLARGESEKQRLAITKALLTNEPSTARALADRIAAYEARRQSGLRVYGP